MPSSRSSSSIIGRRLRQRREVLGWSLERVGVEIGLDESSARARISRYELGTHQPPEQTTVQLAKVLGVPHAYLHCENDRLAEIILATSELPASDLFALLNSLRNRLEELKSERNPKG
jgi:transcriptional regulator with XRE-family HTH domain